MRYRNNSRKTPFGISNHQLHSISTGGSKRLRCMHQAPVDTFLSFTHIIHLAFALFLTFYYRGIVLYGALNTYLALPSVPLASALPSR